MACRSSGFNASCITIRKVLVSVYEHNEGKEIKEKIKQPMGVVKRNKMNYCLHLKTNHDNCKSTL